MLRAGTAKVDITPKMSVWMDGMPRDHKSEGVHDPIFARALVICEDEDKAKGIVLVSCDVCAFDMCTTDEIRKLASQKTGLPPENMVIAATHTHSGPSTHGYFNPKDEEYLKFFVLRVVQAIGEANESLRPAAIGWESGHEDTISYYRRLWTKEGKILMNWEEYPPENIIGPAEEADNEVGVIKIVSAEDPKSVIVAVFNHPGHPNILSGENFLISADYPGEAARIIEEKLGGIAMFLNGAKGSVDIDGLKDRDIEGIERAGKALADVVVDIARKIEPEKEVKAAAKMQKFGIPVRTMTPEELSWAREIMDKASGEVVTLRDGVGDEWKANLFLELNKKKGSQISMEMIGIALGDAAFLSFPGELFNEIGKAIKEQSPFKHTYIIDSANDCTGYFPTKKAIGEGGYAVETRNCDASAEEIIVGNSLEILKSLK
jgi:hypothetical protein